MGTSPTLRENGYADSNSVLACTFTLPLFGGGVGCPI